MAPKRQATSAAQQQRAAVAMSEAQLKRLAAVQSKVRAAEDEKNVARSSVRIKLQDLLAEHCRKVDELCIKSPNPFRIRIVRKMSKVNLAKRRAEAMKKLKKRYEMDFTREKKRICEENRLARRKAADAFAEELEVQASVHSKENLEEKAEIQRREASIKALEAEEGQVKKKPKASGRTGAASSAPSSRGSNLAASRKGKPDVVPSSRSPSPGKSAPRLLGKASAPAPLLNRVDINGTWKAVCDGIEFSVEVDYAGGMINSVPVGGYQELFKIHGKGDAKSPYTIGLNRQKWELQVYEHGKLSWVGKKDGLLSLWTRENPVAPVGATRSIQRSSIPKASSVPKAPAMVAAPVRMEDLPPGARPPSNRIYQPKAPPQRRQVDFQPSREPPTPEESGPPDVELEPEVLSDVSEYVEPPRRVILTDPFIHGFVASPAPDVDDLVEPSKTHLEEVIATVDPEEDPFTKTAFAESAF
jgi:hypothetical protein